MLLFVQVSHDPALKVFMPDQRQFSRRCRNDGGRKAFLTGLPLLPVPISIALFIFYVGFFEARQVNASPSSRGRAQHIHIPFMPCIGRLSEMAAPVEFHPIRFYPGPSLVG